MRNGWTILMALAIAGGAHAQAGKPADPKAPAAKAAQGKATENRGPRTGPGQAAGADGKAAAPEVQKPAK